MAVKLTKNELKAQKDALKRFERYLPTLQLKKQQLQSVMLQLSAQLDALEARRAAAIDGLDDWVAVFSENRTMAHKLQDLVEPESVICGEENIAGVIVPVFRALQFREIDYDPGDYPLWVDTAVVKLQEIAGLDAEAKTLRRRAELLEQSCGSRPSGSTSLKRSRSPRPRKTSASSASTWATSRLPPSSGARSPRTNCGRWRRD